MGQWYHLVGVWDASENDAKLYLDGVLQSGAGATGYGWGGTQNTYVACRGGSDHFFDGEIDEVSIWDVTLDADAVTAVYNSGQPINLGDAKGNYDNEGDLVSWWRMGDNDSGAGTTVTDNEGSNDGTLVNTPTSVVDTPPNYSNYALEFNGSNEYATSSADSTLASKTYTFWAKSTDTTANTLNAIFDHGSVTNGAFYFNANTSRPLLYMGSSYYRYWVDNSSSRRRGVASPLRLPRERCN